MKENNKPSEKEPGAPWPAWLVLIGAVASLFFTGFNMARAAFPG